MGKEPLRPLSDAVFGPVTKAYKAGGLGLAFLGLGAFLMLAAFLLPNRGVLGYVLVAVGFLLIALTCTLFLAKDVLPLFRLRRGIQDNRALIDAVQATALQVTEVASDLQALAFKHAYAVAGVMQEARPLLRKVPIVGQFADSDAIMRVDSLSSAIVEYTTRAKGIIGDVEEALVKSDASKLQQYMSDLREVRVELEKLLKA